MALEIDDESEDTVASRHIWLTYCEAAMELEQTMAKVFAGAPPAPRPPQPTRNELGAALTQCLHVIEKGIEVRMDEKWSVLRHILPDAVRQARRVLGLPPRKSGEFEAMDRMYGTGDPAACFHEWQGFECTKCGITRREYDAKRNPPQ